MIFGKLLVTFSGVNNGAKTACSAKINPYREYLRSSPSFQSLEQKMGSLFNRNSQSATPAATSPTTETAKDSVSIFLINFSKVLRNLNTQKLFRNTFTGRYSTTLSEITKNTLSSPKLITPYIKFKLYLHFILSFFTKKTVQ